MSRCISARTNPDATYPGYVNFTREEDGSVSVTVRGDPTKRDGAYVCGFARDKGQPGRCTPGDDRCNNYCNLAPQKGPMQRAPLPCTQVICGETVKVTLTSEAFASLLAPINSLRLRDPVTGRPTADDETGKLGVG